ncbi:MAG: hypothetical protein KDA89_03645 [Planctomycetaceae bacterium]|nr:hypothetical protein [Planctomycetaceae bacterium]
MSANFVHRERHLTCHCLPMSWLILIVFDVCLVALVYAQEDRPSPAPAASSAAGAETSVAEVPDGNGTGRIDVVRIEGPADVADESVRFEALDVFLDSGERTLAAYQFELSGASDGIEIVGIEGGEHPAFSEPPYYDPKAMNNDRVIIAAFSTSDRLPSGRSRVARIHLQLQGPGNKEYRTNLSVSASADGERIPATVQLVKTGA